MNAINKIMTKLDEIFAPLDAEVLIATQKWAKERQQAMYAFQSSDEYASLRGDAFKRHKRVTEICGGKTWYDAMNGGDEYLENYVTKNCAATAKSRNARITAKLVKAGISEVISEEISHTNDGFNGVFFINTDNGQKRVMIETIRAGGYNIQCLHLRVLVKVK